MIIWTSELKKRPRILFLEFPRYIIFKPAPKLLLSSNIDSPTILQLTTKELAKSSKIDTRIFYLDFLNLC